MSIPQNFPNISAPFVDGNGNIQQSWLQFLRSLWNRTGAAQGGAIFSPGDIKAITYDVIPEGWLLCDGSAVSRSAFVVLYNTIGTTWGSGDGIKTFNLPNFAGRSLLGVGGSYVFAASGGSPISSLTIPNLPAHNHGVSDPGHVHGITDSGHTHTIPTGTLAGVGAFNANVTPATTTATGNNITGISINSAVTGISTTNTGSGTSFNTISPYAVVNYIIKT